MQIHQGIDIIGNANQLIIAVAGGVVLETEEKLCEGPSLVIDHGKSITGERLIAIYILETFLVKKEGDKGKRGMPVAKYTRKNKISLHGKSKAFTFANRSRIL